MKPCLFLTSTLFRRTKIQWSSQQGLSEIIEAKTRLVAPSSCHGQLHKELGQSAENNNSTDNTESADYSSRASTDHTFLLLHHDRRFRFIRVDFFIKRHLSDKKFFVIVLEWKEERFFIVLFQWKRLDLCSRRWSLKRIFFVLIETLKRKDQSEEDNRIVEGSSLSLFSLS